MILSASDKAAMIGIVDRLLASNDIPPIRRFHIVNKAVTAMSEEAAASFKSAILRTYSKHRGALKIGGNLGAVKTPRGFSRATRNITSHATTTRWINIMRPEIRNAVSGAFKNARYAASVLPNFGVKDYQAVNRLADVISNRMSEHFTVGVRGTLARAEELINQLDAPDSVKVKLYKKAVNAVMEKQKEYVERSIEDSSRLLNSVSMAMNGLQEGYELFTFWNPWDDKTSQICWSMYGVTFSAEDVERHIGGILANPDITASHPWVGQRGITQEFLGAAMRKGPANRANLLRSHNFGMPPLHGRCRSELRGYGRVNEAVRVDGNENANHYSMDWDAVDDDVRAVYKERGRPAELTAIPLADLPEVKVGLTDGKAKSIRAAFDKAIPVPPIEIVQIGKTRRIEDGELRVALSREYGFPEIIAVVHYL